MFKGSVCTHYSTAQKRLSIGNTLNSNGALTVENLKICTKARIMKSDKVKNGQLLRQNLGHRLSNDQLGDPQTAQQFGSRHKFSNSNFYKNL